MAYNDDDEETEEEERETTPEKKFTQPGQLQVISLIEEERQEYKRKIENYQLQLQQQKVPRAV